MSDLAAAGFVVSTTIVAIAKKVRMVLLRKGTTTTPAEIKIVYSKHATHGPEA
jgi:tRNA A37 threonylcarbamoyladenosine dehydratase